MFEVRNMSWPVILEFCVRISHELLLGCSIWVMNWAHPGWVCWEGWSWPTGSSALLLAGYMALIKSFHLSEHTFIQVAFKKLPSEVHFWENVRICSHLLGFLMWFSVMFGKKSKHLETTDFSRLPFSGSIDISDQDGSIDDSHILVYYCSLLWQ